MATALVALPALGSAASLDLTGFTKFGGGSGNWNVAVDNLSVTQTTNTSTPTAFVGGTDFIDSSFEGQFEVNSGGDDDFIGFVFGFGADDSAPFFMFDWKQRDQSASNDGFTLAYVTGGLGVIPFGAHQVDTAGYDVLATDVDIGTADPLGWAVGTIYDFKLTYQSNRILIEVGGGAPLTAGLQTIFDITPADVAGVSSFDAGRFGFFNYSQDDVTYAGFTETAAPIPLPAGGLLLISGLGVFAMRRRAA